VYKQQHQEQQQEHQDAENPFLDPPFSRIKIILEFHVHFLKTDVIALDNVSRAYTSSKSTQPKFMLANSPDRAQRQVNQKIISFIWHPFL
jgi:16S rRNA G966 N2-methylase RsmD